MSMIDRNGAYPSADKYWDLVKRTLKEVFQEDPDLADDLQQEIAGNAPEEQLLFYHVEPLDVAADIVGQQPSNKQIKKYRLLADQAGWSL